VAQFPNILIDESNMKAITQNKYGSPAEVLKLETVKMPTIKDDEVLVRVQAAATHIGDWLLTRGWPYLVRLMPKAKIPGMEMSGIVEYVGKDVKEFGPCDEVFGWGKYAFAEYATFSEKALLLKPSNATFEQAAAIPISGFTALQAVRDHGEVKAGHKVLVIGASGAVGTFAVQIAKSYGAEVTGVGSARNEDLVRSIGADHYIDYSKQEITDGGRQYDVILDTAGNRSLSLLRRPLAKKGALVIVGGSGGKWLMGVTRSIRATMLSPLVSQRLRMFLAKNNKEDLAVLKELIESGDVTPIIDKTYKLNDAAQAVENVGERHSRGKTVISVGG
jgi:NADPH:quinone reductase-like Zn-dependent oxidoreductase